MAVVADGVFFLALLVILDHTVCAAVPVTFEKLRPAAVTVEADAAAEAVLPGPDFGVSVVLVEAFRVEPSLARLFIAAQCGILFHNLAETHRAQFLQPDEREVRRKIETRPS